MEKITKEEWESCHNCDNSGAICETGLDEYIDEEGRISQDIYPIYTQCEFCCTNPKSVFNQQGLLDNNKPKKFVIDPNEQPI